MNKAEFNSIKKLKKKAGWQCYHSICLAFSTGVKSVPEEPCLKVWTNEKRGGLKVVTFDRLPSSCSRGNCQKIGAGPIL